MTFAWAIVLLVLLPLVAAALAFAFPKSARWFALGTIPGILAGAAWLTQQVIASGVQIHRAGGWGAPLGIDLRADGPAVLMLGIAALFVTAVSLYSVSYLRSAKPDEGRNRQRYFWPLLLFLWGALNALFLSADIFNLYVTLELLGFAAVSLVALAGQREALAAAMRYLLVSLGSALCYLLGVGLLFGQYGTVDLRELGVVGASGPVTWVALALITGGLVTKAALFPMHFWLPPAHANAPAPVSALLSALVVKASFYILLKIWFEAFPELLTTWVAQAFGVLGAAAIFYGKIRALGQARLKLMIAYSTVAQVGYLFLVFPLAGTSASGRAAWAGGLIFLAAHACAKTALFLTAGNIQRAVGHDRIKDLTGATQALPISAFAFGVSALCLVGLPPSLGFAGKWLLLGAGLAQGQWWWVAVILLGSLLSAAYLARVVGHAFTRLNRPGEVRAIPPMMEWTALALGLVAVGLGFAAHGLAELLEIGAPTGSFPAMGGNGS